MSRRTIPIKVKSKDLSQVGELLRGGIQQVGVVLRALSLRQLAAGFSAPQVAQALPLTAKAVRQIAHRYMNNGLGTRSLTIPPNPSSAWMRNRSRCMPTCELQSRRS